LTDYLPLLLAIIPALLAFMHGYLRSLGQQVEEQIQRIPIDPPPPDRVRAAQEAYVLSGNAEALESDLEWALHFDELDPLT
jgi:hypothetical protein